MAVRAGMAELINLVRRIIGDAAGASQVFSDQEIQDTLDGQREDVRYKALMARLTQQVGLSLSLDWYAEEAHWDGDTVLVDASFNTLTPSSSQPLFGRWSFSSSQACVLVNGRRYDVYRSAAELVEQWLAKVALEFDFAAGDQRYSRSQKSEYLRKLLSELHGKAGLKSIPMQRWDA